MLICCQTIQNDFERSLVEELYHNYIGTMIYTAKLILKDQYRAEDAASQAFVKIIDNLQKFSWDDRNKTKGFVVIIVRNICYNMLKTEKRERIIPMEEYELLEECEKDEPLDYMITEESYDFILSCISALCDNHKDILRLKIIYEYSDDEIAQILGISWENARVRLHRARKALMDMIQKRGGDYEQVGTE